MASADQRDSSDVPEPDKNLSNGEPELSQRVRTLTEKGDSMYQEQVSTFNTRLTRLHHQLDTLLSPSANISFDELS